jgi:GalNAc-alpha-(1->4)-GalNAc-alpha-(1->3)-diNAcBac-PP-undecaprenol alpha-1,4-N-acetyl-D-galactosaminyltransferase
VEVACLKRWGPVADQLRDGGVKTTALEAGAAHHLPRTLARLVRLVRGGRHDTVFSFLVHANALAAAASRFCRGVRFLQSVQTTQSHPSWHWKLQRLVHKAAERVVVPTNSVADVTVARSRVPRDKIVVIPNAVDPGAFPRSPIPERDPRPYPFGFIGRLDPVKRVPWIIGDMAMRHLRSADVEFHVFGEGPERGAIEQAVERTNAKSWVTMHGAVASPQAALAQLGGLVLASEAEGFGLVLIEAMAAGVPVIGTRVSGIRDVIRDGETGLLVNFASPAELHFAVGRIVDDVALRNKLIDNGLREVRERFSWDRVIQRYHDVLGIPIARPQS